MESVCSGFRQIIQMEDQKHTLAQLFSCCNGLRATLLRFPLDFCKNWKSYFLKRIKRIVKNRTDQIWDTHLAYYVECQCRWTMFTKITSVLQKWSGKFSSLQQKYYNWFLYFGNLVSWKVPGIGLFTEETLNLLLMMQIYRKLEVLKVLCFFQNQSIVKNKTDQIRDTYLAYYVECQCRWTIFTKTTSKLPEMKWQVFVTSAKILELVSGIGFTKSCRYRICI